jgi:type III restriction enzyme
LQRGSEINLLGEEIPGRRRTETTRILSLGANSRQSPQSTIISALLDFSLVDYDDEDQRPLLLKLSKQAVNFYKTKSLDEENLELIIESNAASIAEDIYSQILKHKKFSGDEYLLSDVKESRKYPVPHTIILTSGTKLVTLDSQVNTFNVKEHVYGPFNKGCHPMCRFDSSDEARFSYILDNDVSVIDWMRPAPTQFEGLYWRDEQGNAQHRYEPDFVVELEEEFVIVEVKPTSEIEFFHVQAKKMAVEKYCEVVNKNMDKAKVTKPWRYKIVPTEKISIRSTINNLLN